MLNWLSYATLLLAAPPSPGSLDCALQGGAAWNPGPRSVAAVVCEGRPGFFVPSAEFRAMLKVEESRPYKLLEKELRLAELEIDALRSADAAADEVILEWKDIAAHHRGNWLKAEDDVQKQTELVYEAVRRSWYESPILWGFLGAVAVSVVWALSKDDPGVTVVTSGGSS